MNRWMSKYVIERWGKRKLIEIDAWHLEFIWREWTSRYFLHHIASFAMAVEYE